MKADSISPPACNSLRSERGQVLLIARKSRKVNMVGNSRGSKSLEVLKKRHRDLLSTGRLLIKALAIEQDLRRRELRESPNKTLLKERKEHEKIVARLIREYKAAIADYLTAIRGLSNR